MNWNKAIRLVALISILMIVVGISQEAAAQCPMCRMAAESNLANGGTEGKGLNKGILYMLSMPYLLVGTIGFIWWRNNKLNQEEKSISDLNGQDNVAS